MSTIEQLEKMEKRGVELFGEIFRETLAYVQIQRLKKEIRDPTPKVIK